MKIEQIYTGCLAQGAYFIQSEKEAVVIDPLREVAPYLDKAAKKGVTIRYVLETHFHADFVSGHLDLAKATGATIVYGPNANPSFDAHIAEDGEEIRVGRITLKVLHTPGHTLESVCYLLRDENGKDVALFTGDTLFIGDVGRPDLAQKSDLSMEDLAGLLYDSLQTKILPLDDDIVIYPAHGAGSACGKHMSRETSDTLGQQKKTNYALQASSKEQFIEEVTAGLTPPPGYFPQNVRMNREGYEGIDEVLARGCQPLDPEEFERMANSTGALILDTREPQPFADGFIPNSINIGIDGNFAPWVGALIPDVAQQLLIVADKGRETEIVTRLARVGFDHAIGYLKGGFDAWKKAGKEIDHVPTVGTKQFAWDIAKHPEINILDVRKPAEYNAEYIADAENLPLDFINEKMDSLDEHKSYYIHCASGYRSMIFISILKARGFDNLTGVTSNFNEFKENDLFRIVQSVPEQL